MLMTEHEEEPERPGCLTLSVVYKWHQSDRMEVVKYVKHLEAQIEQLKLCLAIELENVGG